MNVELLEEICLKYKDKLRVILSKADRSTIETETKLSGNEAFWLLTHNWEYGKCEICGKKTSFYRIADGYKKYCSKECSSKSKAIQLKIRHSKTPRKIKEKSVKKIHNWPEIISKRSQTYFEKTGYTHPSKNPEVIQAKAQRYFEKTGYTHHWSNPEILKEKQQKYFEKTGFEFNSQNPEVKKKKEGKCFINVPRPTSEQLKAGNTSRRKTIRSKNFEKFVQQIRDIKHLEFIGTREDYISSNFSCKCLRCNREFHTDKTNYQDIFCVCGESKAEIYISEWLTSLGINVKQRDRKVLNGKELDIYLPDYNIAIEYDGLYWHSEEYCDKNYHLTKTQECKEQSIQLIHVFENEWLTKQDIVKSIIFAKLGKFETRIPARKCKVVQLDNKIYREFLEQNHIQGFVGASLKLGLEYGGQIVAIMSFGKSRFKSGETELLRYCSLLNTQIIGGFSKLLKASQLNNIVTYCDLRYSDGSGYVKNGFEVVGQSSPNYWYWKYNSALNLESRQKYQKHKLPKLLENFDPNLTEIENMVNHGYLRIFDCGNLKLKSKIST